MYHERGGRGTYEIVNNLGNPGSVTVENKTVDANILVVCNTKLLNQSRLLTKSAKSSHEPAITISSLPNIIRSRAIDVKTRLFKDITNALHALRTEIFTRLVVLNIRERVQTVVAVELEINFNVKVRITILLVDSTALFDDLFDFGAACCCGVFVGCLGCCGGYLVASFGGEISVSV